MTRVNKCTYWKKKISYPETEEEILILASDRGDCSVRKDELISLNRVDRQSKLVCLP